MGNAVPQTEAQRRAYRAGWGDAMADQGGYYSGPLTDWYLDGYQSGRRQIRLNAARAAAEEVSRG